MSSVYPKNSYKYKTSTANTSIVDSANRRIWREINPSLRDSAHNAESWQSTNFKNIHKVDYHAQ